MDFFQKKKNIIYIHLLIYLFDKSYTGVSYTTHLHLQLILQLDPYLAAFTGMHSIVKSRSHVSTHFA